MGEMGEPAATLIERLRARPAVAIGAAAGVVVLVIAIALVALRGSSSATAAAGGSASDAPLARYLELVAIFDRALPIDDAHKALDGIAQEAQDGTLDADARREKLKACAATVASQKETLTRVAPPEPATAYRTIVLEQYDRLADFTDVALDQLHIYEEIERLLQRKREVESDEDRSQLAADVRSAQVRIDASLQHNRAIEERSRELAGKRKAEEDRLVAEYHLARPSPPPAPGPSEPAPDDEALARDPFCAALLQMGATVHDCRVAREP